MSKLPVFLTIVFAAAAIAACGRSGGDEAAAEGVRNGGSGSGAVQSGSSRQQDGQVGAPFSASLSMGYDGALPLTNQVILGVFGLEQTELAITGKQASEMLPLWQALRSGTIQNQAERAAIMGQIEAVFTAEQFQAIADLQLTAADQVEWAEANGVELPQAGQGVRGARGEQGGPGGNFADMSPEERAALRQEMQSLSPNERRQRLQEIGVELPENAGPGGGQGGAGGARFGALFERLVRFLEERAAP